MPSTSPVCVTPQFWTPVIKPTLGTSKSRYTSVFAPLLPLFYFQASALPRGTVVPMRWLFPVWMLLRKVISTRKLRPHCPLKTVFLPGSNGITMQLALSIEELRGDGKRQTFTDEEDGLQEDDGPTRMQTLFESVLQIESFALTRNTREYDDDLVFSDEEELGDSSPTSSPKSLRTTNLFLEEAFDDTALDFSCWEQVLEPYSIDTDLDEETSYFRFKCSELAAFQQYVYESSKKLDLAFNSELLVSVQMMMNGMKAKLKSLSTEQLSIESLARLDNFSSHIQMVIDSATLQNHRRHALNGEFSSSSYLFNHSTINFMPELKSIDHSFGMHQSKINCYEERGYHMTALSTLQRIEARLSIALQNHLISPKDYEHINGLLHWITWKLCVYSITNTEASLYQKESQLNQRLGLLDATTDDQSFSLLLRSCSEECNATLSLLQHGLHTARNLFQTALQRSDHAAGPNNLSRSPRQPLRISSAPTIGKAQGRFFVQKRESQNDLGYREFLKSRHALEQVEKVTENCHTQIHRKTLQSVMKRGSSYVRGLLEELKGGQRGHNTVKLVGDLQRLVKSPENSEHFKTDFRYIQMRKCVEQCKSVLEN
ncbi:hypothetical protein PROFUN_11507 [Planoprotostelium fungivorum]|uniref:Uncharacterized protein n=1 Tax=Planoprotostelium fungivorum TaxID=1890364 RepID=A0A2P6N9Y9_9EUKA|nr:hypothetical protein PROFUN_11507 [Planoprotostelium fungivorum]